jgi:hypothetical protein
MNEMLDSQVLCSPFEIRFAARHTPDLCRICYWTLEIAAAGERVGPHERSVGVWKKSDKKEDL